MKCKYCSGLMVIDDQDPELGTIFICLKCNALYYRLGPGNAFDTPGWRPPRSD